MDEPKPTPLNLLVPGSIVLAGAVVALAVIYVGRGGALPAPAAQGTANTGTANSAVAGVQAANLADDDPFLGDPSAPVAIIEFSDFQCPFCARFFSDAEPRIIDTYVKTGKVKFIYRDFPLSSIHAEAQKAAEAGECADEQGKFWLYHDLVFRRQSQLGVENLKAWAAELGFNTQQFNSCLDSGKYAAEVAKDFSDGQAAGVRGTPTFFINGQSVVGALPFEQFQSAIEAALAQQ
ncbi:MAG: hypothetical protein A3B37_02660 [Candidatus Sungbacteria bacterium RIFCSPLOWO2_01_FULL_59_16]|uniref:Thioredoxin domain-containing protein n=1 Tax=Candidatus Sungbacteria bacterium RIFCSPLOWO2_01_FULL_59_16 TaxID=1802280 RepID=A0A1G2LAT1_9BACT|nr:MAG: hypothetical protein A3B37_02660 [Candidatus Sungbacteria bacterium RIFCSPLOWO2_01_FULL_59_16]